MIFSTRVSLATALLVASVVSVPSRARAQSSTALAESLFREGKALMEGKRYDEACPKLAESAKLDPSSGTMLGLALCHEGQGKIASAWGDYSDVVSLARKQGRPDREELATKKLAELGPRLSRVVIDAAPGVDRAALVLSLDKRELSAAVLGSPFPVDPGEHGVVVSAPGKKSWTASFAIRGEHENARVLIPRLEAAPPPPLRAEATSDPADGWSGRKIGTLTALGVGAVGLGLGTTFGLVTIAKHGDLSNHCVGTTCTDASSPQIAKDARTTATISDVCFVAGGAAIALGAVLWLTLPSSRTRVTPAVSARYRGVTIEESF